MRKIVLIILFVLFTTNSFGQKSVLSSVGEIRKNSVYFEFMGNGVLYSMNYDRIFPLKNNKAMYFRIGTSDINEEENNSLSFSLIGETGILFGGPNNFLDSGIGYTYLFSYLDRLLAFRFGYRYAGKKGFSFRAAPMYIYNSEKGDTFGNCLWFALSLGYSF